MTRIFISHSHSDKEIAELLVDFLYAATPGLRPEDIRCTSVPGHQLPFGTSISEQLKGDLNKTTGLIALITRDSLRSTWVLFELGCGWGTERLVVPILGPGLEYKDLPGPLTNYPGVRIEDENPSYLLTDAINQLASTIGIQTETNARRQAKLDSFIKAFKNWKSQSPVVDTSQQEQIDSLNNQLKELEESYQKQLQEVQTLSQQEKEELKRDYERQKHELEQSLRSQISQLQQQLEQERSQYQSSIKQAQAKLAEKETENAELHKTISRLNQQSQPSNQEIQLKSERGVNYTNLRDLLAAGKWKEADQETAKVMCMAAGRVDEGWLDTNSIDTFPCEDLRTINQLWLHYSKGKFGFSVQKEIYESLGGTREYNEKVWEKFGDRVGWRKGGKWLNYSDLTFNLGEASPAHLPFGWSRRWWFGLLGMGGGGCLGPSSLLWRAKTCNL